MDAEYIWSHQQLRAALTYARRELAKQPMASKRPLHLTKIDDVLEQAKTAAISCGISKLPRATRSAFSTKI